MSAVKNMTDAGPSPIEPCPFCGSSHIEVIAEGTFEWPSGWVVECDDCRCSGPQFKELGEMAARQRGVLPRDAAEAERLARAGWSALAGLRLALERIRATRAIDVVGGIVKAEHILEIAGEELNALHALTPCRPITT